MAKSNDGTPWRLCARTAPLTRAFVASCALAMVGLFAGGPIGVLAAVFFAVGAFCLGIQRASGQVLAELSVRGVRLRIDAGQDRSLAWPEVGAVLLWTRQTPGRPRHDALAVLTRQELPMLTETRDSWDPPSGPCSPLVDSLANVIPLSGCILAAEDLRGAIARFGAAAPVIDRRQ